MFENISIYMPLIYIREAQFDFQGIFYPHRKSITLSKGISKFGCPRHGATSETLSKVIFLPHNPSAQQTMGLPGFHS
jgi:hypothetical protein